MMFVIWRMRHEFFFSRKRALTRASLSRSEKNQILQWWYIGHASNPWITHVVPHGHKSKKNTRERPSTSNIHRLSLIHEHNTMATSRVVKPQRRRGSTLAAKHPPRELRRQQGSTLAAKHPPRAPERQLGPHALSSKASVLGGPTRQRR
jgi:hypothetical protein